MTGPVILAICIALSFVALAGACALAALRIAGGPGSADRLVGIYAFSMIAGGFAVTIGIKTGIAGYFDIALIAAFLGPLSLIAFAGFRRNRADTGENRSEGDSGG